MVGSAVHIENNSAHTSFPIPLPLPPPRPPLFASAALAPPPPPLVIPCPGNPAIPGSVDSVALATRGTVALATRGAHEAIVTTVRRSKEVEMRLVGSEGKLGDVDGADAENNNDDDDDDDDDDDVDDDDDDETGRVEGNRRCDCGC